jgi:hypothetical protein
MLGEGGGNIPEEGGKYIPGGIATGPPGDGGRRIGPPGDGGRRNGPPGDGGRRNGIACAGALDYLTGVSS